MIDLHSHILPGVDDGPATLEESLELARSAASDGIRVIAATPHVRDDYPTTPTTMERLLAELRAAIQDQGIPIDVRPGGEIAIAWLDRLSEGDLVRFGLGGSPHYLLVEFPYAGWPLSLHEWVFRLVTRQITPVIAHPERNADVQANPDELRPLVDAGALVQITAASLDGRIGRSSKAAAMGLIDGDRHGRAASAPSGVQEARLPAPLAGVAPAQDAATTRGQGHPACARVPPISAASPARRSSLRRPRRRGR